MKPPCSSVTCGRMSLVDTLPTDPDADSITSRSQLGSRARGTLYPHQDEAVIEVFSESRRAPAAQPVLLLAPGAAVIVGGIPGAGKTTVLARTVRWASSSSATIIDRG